MKKNSSKKIKNSTLIVWFFLFVVIVIVISLIVRIIVLISQSKFDNNHQFILEVKEQNKQEEIIAFNPTANTIGLLQIVGVKNIEDIQSLQIPIDAQFVFPDTAHPKTLSSLLFTMIFHCGSLECKKVNAIDALKLYLFTKNTHQNAIKTASLSLPGSQLKLDTLIPSLFIDDTLYHEALSISVINDSGEPGLGNKLGKLLTNIGGNVISISAGDTQRTTTMQSIWSKDKYTIQRMQQVIHINSQKMQKTGISDIIISIGQQHPQF